MNEIIVPASAWLQAVLVQVPEKIRAIYIEYGDSYTSKNVHLVSFNAFGYESLANGRFDPTIKEHIGELGDFQWEPTDDCSFPADECPMTDWMAMLKEAVQTCAVMKLAAAKNIQLVIGEHDADAFVIR